MDTILPSFGVVKNPSSWITVAHVRLASVWTEQLKADVGPMAAPKVVDYFS